MYVHIGGFCALSDRYIIGVFDFDGTTAVGSPTIDYLRHAEQTGQIESLSDDPPRSFIITLDRVYLSPVSAHTIRQRLSEPVSLRVDDIKK